MYSFRNANRTYRSMMSQSSFMHSYRPEGFEPGFCLWGSGIYSSGLRHPHRDCLCFLSADVFFSFHFHYVCECRAVLVEECYDGQDRG